MEKLEKVVAGLSQCHRDLRYRDCDVCPYGQAGRECQVYLMEDALTVIADLETRLELLRTELAEERDRSARWLRESDPVVHAHWEQYTDEDECWGDLSYFRCTACGTVELTGRKRCPECGAHMDEEATDV